MWSFRNNRFPSVGKIWQRYKTSKEYEEYKGFVFINFGFVFIKFKKFGLSLMRVYKANKSH